MPPTSPSSAATAGSAHADHPLRPSSACAPATASSTSAPGSAATSSSAPAAARHVVALDYAADEVVETRATSARWSPTARSRPTSSSASCAATPPGCRSRRLVRRRHHVRGARAHPGRRRRDRRDGPGAASRAAVRRHRAELDARVVNWKLSPTSTTHPRASAATCASTPPPSCGRSCVRRPRRRRLPPRPRPALAVLVAEVRGRPRRDDHPRSASTGSSSSGTSSSSPAPPASPSGCWHPCSARAPCSTPQAATHRRPATAHPHAATSARRTEPTDREHDPRHPRRAVGRRGHRHRPSTSPAAPDSRAA
jgi:hypothetical protein